MAITPVEKSGFLKLFIRNYRVLDMDETEFDCFTEQTVGFALTSYYTCPMDDSLVRYLGESDGESATKLLGELLDYYEKYCQREMGDGSSEYYSDLYKGCREVIDREREDVLTSAMHSDLYRQFSSEYMRGQIDDMLRAREENPTEAIGKAKELVESCCKKILEESGVELNKRWTVQEHVSETMKILHVRARDINNDTDAGKTVRKILGSLSGLAGSIAELRGPFGDGHGKGDNYRGLSVRHAKLAVGSSVALVEYLWDAYLWRQEQARAEGRDLCPHERKDRVQVL